MEEYVRALGIPAVFFMPGFYITNFAGTLMRRAGPSEPWTLSFPGDKEASQVPIFHPADTGKYVKGIVLHRDKLLGRNLPAATAYMSLSQMLDEFKATFPEAGKDATFVQVPADAYVAALTGRGMPEFAAEELLQNMQLLSTKPGGYFGGLSLDEAHSILEDKLVTWKDFMKSSPVFKDLK